MKFVIEKYVSMREYNNYSYGFSYNAGRGGGYYNIIQNNITAWGK